jgi:hypothetical protein
MTTALKIIKAGFRKATINAGYKPLNATETADALEILNDLIIQWNASGVLTGIDPVTSLDTDLFEPGYATRPLKLAVGVEICVEFGKPIDPGMAAIASNAYKLMLTRSIPPQTVEMPDTFPLGSGNYYDYWEGDYHFFPQNTVENF